MKVTVEVDLSQEEVGILVDLQSVYSVAQKMNHRAALYELYKLGIIGRYGSSLYCSTCFVCDVVLVYVQALNEEKTPPAH